MPTKSTATISSVIEQSGGFILRTPEKERFISCDTKPSVVNIWEKNNNEDRYTSLNKTFFDKHFKANEKKITSGYLIDIEIIAKTWDESINNVSKKTDQIAYLKNNNDILKNVCNLSLNFNNSEDVINKFKNDAVIKALADKDTIINKLRESFDASSANSLKSGIVYINKKNNITSQDLRNISAAMSATSKQITKELREELLESKEELLVNESEFLETFCNNLMKKMESLGI